MPRKPPLDPKAPKQPDTKGPAPNDAPTVTAQGDSAVGIGSIGGSGHTIHVTIMAPDQHPVFKAELEENFPIARCSVPVAEAPASSLDGYKQDVFVHALEAGPDREWLRKVLRPALLKRNLRVWDADQFLLGMPRIRAIESAVESSRYTVAVLSPAYLENGFSELGDLIAQHLGTEQRSYRLLGVIRQTCTPRLGMRMAPLLDLTPTEDFEAQVDRLAYSIRQPLPRP